MPVTRSYYRRNSSPTKSPPTSSSPGKNLTTTFIKKLSKERLREELGTRNLDIDGKKTDLVNRLLDSIEAGIVHQSNGKSSHSMGSSKQNGNGSAVPRVMSKEARQHLKEEREAIVIWKKPFTTLSYGTKELFYVLAEWGQSSKTSPRWMLAHKLLIGLILLLALAGTLAYYVEGPHRELVSSWEKYLLWCAWWVGLGVLSSVGLGTGLHTFLLYLGPHIAAVTLAAYECGSTNFPSPPYPDSIVCPDDETENIPITIWAIMSKVRVEAFCWGAGTALGELPPYFMARAHRLSGYDPDEEEDEFDELNEKLKNKEDLSTFDRAKLGIEKIVEKVGFFGILACASIPNPLFDLAGITCGHFLVPFWTFFGATLIGKAVVKMHIQKIFIILAFNESLIEAAVANLNRVPYVGAKLQGPFKELLAKQKEKLHRKVGEQAVSDSNMLGWIFEKFVLAMVFYFVISIVNSLAQSYHKRINKKRKST